MDFHELGQVGSSFITKLTYPMSRISWLRAVVYRESRGVVYRDRARSYIVGYHDIRPRAYKTTSSSKWREPLTGYQINCWTLGVISCHVTVRGVCPPWDWKYFFPEFCSSMDIRQRLWIPKLVHFNTKVVENVRSVKVCGQLSWTKGKAEMKKVKSFCVSLPSLKEERET